MPATQLHFDLSPPLSRPTLSTPSSLRQAPVATSGLKGKARDLIAAIRTLKTVEAEQRRATDAETLVLQKFMGFGTLAKELFPDPVTGWFKEGWQTLGEELKSLLTRDEYDSAKRTTFNAFYTSPSVMQAMFDGLDRLGLPPQATVLEPGCGPGRFIGAAPAGHRFLGVELDSLSGRIAKELHPDADIRIENFRDSRLPVLDGVVGNVPFADVTLDFRGNRFALHDYFFAKSVDALKPGGVLALVTSRFTLDKLDGSVREYLGDEADFVGAIRLPSNAFTAEGTKVVTDIVFLRKRAPGEQARHVDADWLKSGTLDIDGQSISVNQYFLNHPEMVLGRWSSENTLYGHGLSVESTGDLKTQLHAAIERLPRFATAVVERDADDTELDVVLPPAESHIDVGSFFVGPDRRIFQQQNGQGVPVVYGGSELSAGGGLVGRRVAALVTLRDQARQVLKSQNDGWPTEQREEARKQLRQSYDRFVQEFGPINKTTFSNSSDGTLIRRMPNCVKFREDPDAYLVFSLEEYDEVTGTAKPAPILLQDVVGPTPPVTQVASAEEGLLVSLNTHGKVFIDLIAKLYSQPETKVIEELGDLIYRDPKTQQWETADAYLSGNVRDKLAEAQQAGPEYARNVAALEAVQPPDVLPGDIDAKLGSPWIPVSDVQVFAAELFRVEPSSMSVGHLAKDALWTVEPDYFAKSGVAATTDFGTARANGVWLLEQALNLKSPTIYDTIQDGDKETRVVNSEETLAAREKQKLIKEKFKAWVFSDPDRTERLVRLYNDAYNAIRPRAFDGGHLDFPGMNQAVHLRDHQKDAVWRGMSAGNTLLAHVVGAGKTFTMAATGMKMKQAGLIQKPMYVVPNHLLEQFSREFYQLYPNAKLLVASKEDLSRDKRKFLTAKIASGSWDGIVVTQSSFERIGMSKDYQAEFLREQIAEYDALLVETARGKGANRNLIKTIEKQKAQREERLQDLLATDKKDDGLVFDELGVDHIFVDEAHHFKNLETPTKMDRVAGLQSGGSERAFDLFMKCRYLGQQHSGHGVTFATGTPISNTMVELYTMQRFLDPEGLKSRGIEHFDAWAGQFGEVVDTMEIAPDGAGLRPRSRFAKFTNLPELQQMFRQFADVQTAEMLNLPRPTLAGGKPTVVACPMSEEQRRLQEELVERYERIRSERVDPREDNALAITTDGRKLATDARMLEATATDHPDSKLNRLVENVARIWRDSTPTKGTQMIFADMGVNPTPWGFSVYAEIVDKLVAAGVSRNEIASIGDADSDAKKQALFDRVRNGTVRVILGSTQKMGTGTNVQKRLIALHHLDAPWKPAEVEQRDGRILRQGNENTEVKIFRYVTQGSFDSYMWQALETKARFIGQVITGANAARQAEDVGGQELSYAEVKAIASGNPAVLTLAETDAELQRLAILKKNHLDAQYIARQKVKHLPDEIARGQARRDGLQADAETLSRHQGMTIGRFQGGVPDAMPALAQALESIPQHVSHTQQRPLGAYRGLEFGLALHPQFAPEVYLQGRLRRHELLSREHRGPRAVLNALKRMDEEYAAEIARAEQAVTLATTQLHDHERNLGRPFEQEEYLKQLSELRTKLKDALAAKPDATPPPKEDCDVATTPEQPSPPRTHEIVAGIKQLQEQYAGTTTIERSPTVTSTAEEPVTARIRRRTSSAQVVNSEQPLPHCDDPDEEPAADHPLWIERLKMQITEAEHDTWHRGSPAR